MNKRHRLIRKAIMMSERQQICVASNGATTSIDCGNHATVQNLHDAAFTVRGWWRVDTDGGGWTGLISKVQWRFIINAAWGVYGVVYCATTNATSRSNIIIPDGLWHYLEMSFNDAGTRKVRLFIDGIEPTYDDNTAGVDPVVADVASNLFVGGIDLGQVVNGAIGWVEISNVVRHTANFIPPSRFNYPIPDANTVRLFRFNEGTGTAIIDYSANAQNATLANGIWIKD